MFGKEKMAFSLISNCPFPIFSYVLPSTPSGSSTPPSFHPPQFLVWLCHILKMHAARRLSLCPGWRLWLVGGSSPGAKLWVFTLRRCCLYGLSLVTLGLSSTEKGLILLRFRPLLLFPLTLKTPTHRVVFTRELVLCY